MMGNLGEGEKDEKDTLDDRVYIDYSFISRIHIYDLSIPRGFPGDL